jgi:glutamyl-tRNA synthetase
MLPSAVDDIAMGVTDVLRGEDHVSNTALQIQMFTALAAEPPRFAHEALLVGSEGKLSKRLGSLGCDALRDSGVEPRRSSRCSRGWGPHAGRADRRTPGAGRDVRSRSFGRAPARFDEAELARLNAAIVHQLPYAQIAARLPEGMGEAAGRRSGRTSSAWPTRASGGAW